MIWFLFLDLIIIIDADTFVNAIFLLETIIILWTMNEWTRMKFDTARDSFMFIFWGSLFCE